MKKSDKEKKNHTKVVDFLFKTLNTSRAESSQMSYPSEYSIADSDRTSMLSSQYEEDTETNSTAFDTQNSA